MAKTRNVNWWEVDKIQTDLETDVEHELLVQREAIPLVFVPGIMGTRLRRPGTQGVGDAGGLPNLRWDPGSGGFMWTNFVGKEPNHRRRMIVGEPADSFSASFLEVHDTDPVGDGWSGIMGGEAPDDHANYHNFLNVLRNHPWGNLGKLFDFPVYAVGYNWSDDAENAGKMLVERIRKIILEAAAVTGLCEKVILITHSMGGIVSRAASELCGGRDLILGIVHGVQPATGAPTAYWRIKAGFEGFDTLGIVQRALGNDGPKVTVILGNIPGGLELLPTKNHRNNSTEADLKSTPTVWLTVRGDNRTLLLARPQPGDAGSPNPYKDIYRVKAVVSPADDDAASSTNDYWGLVDPSLLNPDQRTPTGGNAHDNMQAGMAPASPWDQYEKLLDIAEAFHDKLDLQAHPYTLCVTGTGQHTADVIELRVESRWVKRTSYPNQGFRGYFTDAAGKHKIAVLQDPAGEGDGTVLVTSGRALNVPDRPVPSDTDQPAKHQQAYEVPAVQDWAIQAVTTLCKLRYYSKR